VASLALRDKSYQLTFCYQSKRYTFTPGEVSQREADNWSAAVDQPLMRMNQGLLRLPDGADLVQFVKSGGKAEEAPQERPAAPYTGTLEPSQGAHLDPPGGRPAETGIAEVCRIRHNEHGEE